MLVFIPVSACYIYLMSPHTSTPQTHSKLKELSKRTTFIRVTQQLNEVFGSRDDSASFAAAAGSKRPLSASSSCEEQQEQEGGGGEGPDAKKLTA